MSTSTSDANRHRDVKRDFGLAYETKNASAALRCYKSTGCPPGASAQMAHTVAEPWLRSRFLAVSELRKTSVIPNSHQFERTSVHSKRYAFELRFKSIGMFTICFGSKRTREVDLLISILRPTRNRVLINLRVVLKHRGCPPFTSVITDIGFVPFTASVVRKTATEYLLNFGC